MASTSTLLARAVRGAFSVAGDVVRDVTWRQLKPGAYVVATGKVTMGHTDTPAGAILQALGASEADALGVSTKGVRMLFMGQELAEITPKAGDQVLHAGITYTVKSATWKAYPAALVAVVDI